MIGFLLVVSMVAPRGFGNPQTVSPGKENATLQVLLQNGLVQGEEMMTDDGVRFFAYRGIPYAEPPLGNLRFRPPEPVSDWDGVLNATYDAPNCAQINDDESSEDCLYINVFTPELPGSTATSDLPIMVWIHGGAFVKGTSHYDIYGPNFLIEREIVFVSFNYRVGIFGFLSTEDMSSPGNYGLKDQIAALRWVQDNIQNFGGNPKNVTIFGQSAGGASVGYMLLAPKSEGLFHRAISESGSILCPWAQQTNPWRIAYQVGVLFGVLDADSDYLVETLRNADGKRLLEVANSATILNLISPLNGLAYSPTIEPIHEDAVFTEESHELLKKGKFHRVPYIIGFTTEESTLIQEYANDNFTRLVAANVMLNNVVPADMNVAPLWYLQVALQIKNFYFGHIVNSNADKEDILKYISDVQFTKPIKETVRQMSKYTQVYFYQFSYEGIAPMKGFNMMQIRRTDDRLVEGVGHGEDLWYLFRNSNLTIQDKKDLEIKKIMSTLWTNFAKFNNPTPERDQLLGNVKWNITTKENQFQYLDIGSRPRMLKNPKKKEMKFWEDLYKTYGQPPFNTY